MGRGKEETIKGERRREGEAVGETGERRGRWWRDK